MVEQPLSKHAEAGVSACAMPSDLGSIVDQLLDAVAPALQADEVDRAVNLRAQMRLVREIRGMIDSDKLEANKAA